MQPLTFRQIDASQPMWPKAIGRRATSGATPKALIKWGDQMDPRFAALTDALAPRLDALLAMKPLHYGELPLSMPGERHLSFFQRPEAPLRWPIQRTAETLPPTFPDCGSYEVRFPDGRPSNKRKRVSVMGYR